MAFTIITDAERDSRGATTLANQPTIPAQELKREFDAPAKEVIIPKFNTLVGELSAQTAAADIGAVAPEGRSGQTVQEVLNDLSTDLSTVEGDSVTDEERAAWNGKSTVTVNQIKTSGERIATITVNGTGTDIYASVGGGGGGGGGAVNSVNGQQGDVVLSVGNIHDVTITGASDDDVLAYDNGTWKNLTLGDVAISNSYNDLDDQPTIPTVDQTYDSTSTNAQSGVAIAGELVTKADASDVAEKLTGGLFGTATSTTGATVYFDGIDPTKSYKIFANYGNSYNGAPVLYTNVQIQNIGTVAEPNYRVTYTLVNATANQSFKLYEIEGNSSILPYYTGSYTTTPRTVSQTLSTANMSMSQNVTVNPISYSEELNAGGGYTATIGDE